MFYKILLVVSVYATVAVASPLVPVKTSVPSHDWRVVGGQNATDGQFPYIISLRYVGVHLCGGSILNENWIVTAAHCVVGISTGYFTVVAGAITLSYGGDYYYVSEIHSHLEYDAETSINDIALLKTTEPIVFNDFVQPLALETAEIAAGVDAVLSGWGDISYPGPPPEYLQFLDVKTISFEECRDAHVGVYPVVPSEICTFTQEGEGACKGDSGGPLVSNGKLIGIVSWGKPCALGYPDVYTKASSYVDWINGFIN